MVTLSRWLVPGFMLVILLVGWLRGVKVYEAFVRGAEEGFATAVKIIPYLVAMMVAIGILRESGAIELAGSFLAPILDPLGIPAEILPLAIIRPFSGGAALGIAADIIRTYGPDSFLGRLASVVQASSDTTFYVATVYFGSVGIVRYRYAIGVGLAADIASFLAGVAICHRIFVR